MKLCNMINLMTSLVIFMGKKRSLSPKVIEVIHKQFLDFSVNGQKKFSVSVFSISVVEAFIRKYYHLGWNL